MNLDGLNTSRLHRVKQIVLKSLKPSVPAHIFVTEGNDWNIKISPSRSSAIIIDNLTWYDRAKDQHNRIFIKITPRIDHSSKKMADSEMKLYNVTSKAMEYGLSRHFVRSFNEELVQNSHVTGIPLQIGGRIIDGFSVLIIEDLGKHSMPLAAPMKELLILESRNDAGSKALLRRNNEIINVLMLQIMHTLYVFHLLGIKHLDLHYGNIRVVPSAPGKYVNTYAISTDKKQVTQGRKSSEIMYLPNVGYEIKIIDYDGAVKMSRQNMIDQRYPPSFRRPISNEHGVYVGGYRNSKNTYLQDFYKVMAEPTRSKFFMEKYKNLLQSKYGGSVLTMNNRMKNRFLGVEGQVLLNNTTKQSIRLFKRFHYFIRANGTDVTDNKHLTSPMEFLLNVVEKEFKTIPNGYIAHPYVSNALYYLPSRPSRQSEGVNSVSVTVPEFDYKKFISFKRGIKKEKTPIKNKNGDVIMKNTNNRRNNRNNLAQRMNRLRVNSIKN